MRVLVTGGSGLLGATLLRSAPEGYGVEATEHRTPVRSVPAHRVDLADGQAVARVWAVARPELVIHTAVGTEDGERDIVQASRNVARASAAIGAPLIHLSTDLVFDGRGSPYPENAAPRPVLAYGVQKLAAERSVRRSWAAGTAVVRTSLILRADPPVRTTTWVLEALGRGERPTLYVDELRCPIAVEDLAAQLWELAALSARERSGVWHLAGPESVSRYALGVMAALRAGCDPTGIRAARSSGDRPRDVRLLTGRADRVLRTRARAASELFARDLD